MKKRSNYSLLINILSGKISMFKNNDLGSEEFYKRLIVGITVLLFFLMPLLSIDYGVTGDEYVDHRHTGYVLDYFFKGDSKALNQPKTLLHYYGISAQVVVRGVIELFGIEDYYEARHAMCSIFGVLTILFTALLARRVGGGLCGVLSMIMLLLVPRFFGHSMNNLKDIPFALGYVFSIFYIIKLFDDYPRFKRKNIILLSLGISFTIGNRAGGLLLVPYLFMYAGLYYINITGGLREFYRLKKHKKDFVKIVSVVVIISTIGYFVSVLLWPYALENPISGPIDSLKLLTKFKMGIRQIFEGKQVMSNLLPKYYAPKYLLITLPLSVLLGFAIYVGISLLKFKKIKLIDFFLLFTAIFPIFWVVYKNSNLYGGIRHFMFVIPILVIISSIAWKELTISIKSKKIRWVFISVLVGLLALPLHWMIVSHPNQYIYFNEIEGGISEAYGNYEMDYYFNTEKRGAEWIKENVCKDLSKEIIVASHGKLAYYFRKKDNVKGIYTRYYERSKKDWDYAVFVNEYINRFQLKSNIFPPKGTVKVFELEGKPICAVVKRLSKEDFYGFAAIKKKKYDEAISHFKNYLKVDPQSEQAWLGLSQAYFFKKDFKSALTSVDNSLKYYPDYISALHVKSLVYIETKQYKKAIKVVDKMLVKRKLLDVMFLKALTYYHMKEYQYSIKILNTILNKKPTHIKSLNLAGNILMEKNDYKQASKLFIKISKSLKNDPDILSKLAKCYTKIGDVRSAYIYLRKLAMVKKGYYLGVKVQAELLIMQKQYDKAAMVLTNLHNKVQNDSELYFLSGLLESRKGNNSRARDFLRKCLVLNKDCKEALVLLDRVSINKN